MECPYCNAENRDGVRYCNNCGRLINPSGAGPDSTTISSTIASGSPIAVPLSSTAGSGPASSRSLTIGSPLQGGRYVIKKVLGQGGMGAALLASDNRLDNKLVVIKELISENTDPAKVEEDEQNFKREVVTLAHLDHPLIPAVTDHFQEGSHYFMVQVYIEGKNLEERMEDLKQPMKEREALSYASQVLDVLDYLEQQKPPIVHRDIKPANIIIGDKDKRAHLVDFGIARADVARNVKRKQTSALGTPGYAPPEQYQGNADSRSDLYALGATLHHLLTNRDPRDYPPFTYPPVRSLNSQLSPEVERVLNRALINDINQRYQSAAAMKQDIDDILLNRFGVSGNFGSYTLNTSGPIGVVNTQNAPTIVSRPAKPSQPAQRQQQASRPPQAINAVPPRNAPPYYAPPVQQQKNNRSGVRSFILLLVVVLLIFAVIVSYNFVRSSGGSGSAGAPTATVTLPATGIGVTKVGNEYIGISDGTFALDSSRVDGDLKSQAAARLKANDVSGAEALWQQAVSKDTSDAEALIYMEDQRVIASNSPYITFVVGTMLTGDNVGVGRDDLQGAYVAQKEYNDGAKLGGVQVRLLVASSGNTTANATTVAQQIVQAKQNDATIVGVMGWPFSSRALAAVAILSAAHIPMVSQTASSDLLTGKSPYFFRVAPSNKDQGIAGAKYAEQTLHAKKVALFFDPADSYSNSLAQDFSQQFQADGNKIVAQEKYTVGKQGTLSASITDALNHNPDLIYFSGYSNDVSTLLTDLPTTGQFQSLPVMGGDALYELAGYQSSARAAGFRLHFTAFAYPDEWDVLGLSAQKPAFFTEYPNAFDPNRQHTTGSPYGYTRADNDVILSYDAMLALLNGSSIALADGKQSFTASDLQVALKKLTGARAFQGVSGQISFGPDGNPINKAFVILYIANGGFIMMENKVQNTFLRAS